VPARIKRFIAISDCTHQTITKGPVTAKCAALPVCKTPRVFTETGLPEAFPRFSDPVENGRIVGVVEGVEQMLLSLARVGIDLSNPQFAEAIHDCVANLQAG